MPENKFWVEIKRRFAKTDKKKVGWFLLYAAVILFALMVFASRYGLFGIWLYSVRSGSMEPAIHRGSLVVVRRTDSIKQGDVITFYTGFRKNTITHRVLEIVNRGQLYYRTKGDANNAPDSVLVPKEMVVGKVIYSLPYLGYGVAFLQTLPGIVLFILVPALVIIIDEGNQLKEEWERLKRRRKQIKTKKQND